MERSEKRIGTDSELEEIGLESSVPRTVAIARGHCAAQAAGAAKVHRCWLPK
jgi:hypothetical protein